MSKKRNKYKDVPMGLWSDNYYHSLAIIEMEQILYRYNN